MTIRNSLRSFLTSFGSASMITLLTACHPGAAQRQAPPTPSVTVAPVEQKQIVEFDEFTGRTEAIESVEVRPRVSGYIQQVKFQSGQLVKKGDVLFLIDPRWHQAEFDRRQADLIDRRRIAAHAMQHGEPWRRIARAPARGNVFGDSAEHLELRRTGRHNHRPAGIAASEPRRG